MKFAYKQGTSKRKTHKQRTGLGTQNKHRTYFLFVMTWKRKKIKRKERKGGLRLLWYYQTSSISENRQANYQEQNTSD